MYEFFLTFQERQSPDITKQKGLSELKATLKDIVHNLAAAASSKQFIQYIPPYHASLDLITGLHLGEMTGEQEQTFLEPRSVQCVCCIFID